MGGFTQEEKDRLIGAAEETARWERRKAQRRLFRKLGILSLPYAAVLLVTALIKLVFATGRVVVKKTTK
jgi:hypothetical protein